MTTCKSICLFLLMFFSLTSFAQNQTIDSLQKVLLTQKEDTIKIKNLFNLGGLYFGLNRYSEGLTAINQARDISKKIKFNPGEGMYMASMVMFHRYNLRMQAVFKHLFDQHNANWNIEDFIQIKQPNDSPDFQIIKCQLFIALKSFDTVLNKESLANIHAALFYRLLDEDKLDSALLHGNTSELYYNDLNKREEAFQLMLDKIFAYDKINNKELLKKEETMAIAYLTSTTNIRTRAYLYEQMGFNYDRIRRPSSLVQCFFKVNEIWEELGNKKGQENACHQLGIYYSGLDQENAINYFLKELSLRKEIKDSNDINETYSSMVYDFIALEKLDDAEKYILLAKKSIGIKPSPFNKARLLDAEGQLMKAKKKYPEAISIFKQSADIFNQLALNVHLSYQYYYLANCYHALSDVSQSTWYAKQSFKLASQENWADLKMNSTLLLSELYEQQHNLPKAYQCLKRYKSIKDEWDSKNEMNRAADFETQSLFSQNQNKIDLLKKNNLIAEARSLQESQLKNFAYFLIAITILFGSYGFYRFRKQKKLESKQSLLNERLRISRDLHDEIGSTLGSISVYSEVAKNRAAKNENETEVLSKIGTASRELIDKMSDIVWSLNPQNETFEHLQNRMQSFAAMILPPHNIAFEFCFDEQLKTTELTSEQRKNIFLIFKEAVYNVVKYAEATEAKVKVKVKEKLLTLEVIDNGKGFDVSNAISYNGNGLKNMKARADEMKGKLDVKSQINEGTRIELELNI